MDILASTKVWLLILVGPFFCLLPDITIKIFSNWFARTPIDWQLKEIADYSSISAVKERDRMIKQKAIREEALKRRAERRKLQPLEYGQEEDDIEVIIAQELGSGSPKSKTPVSVGPPTPLMEFEIGEDYYGEQHADDPEASPENKSKKTGAKYKKSKSKKKKATINPDDSGVTPIVSKKTTLAKKK